MRSWVMLCATFALINIGIGVYFSQDRASKKKGKVNVIGPYRYCPNHRCTEHQFLRKTERLACMRCRHPLVEPSLEDLEGMELPQEDAANLDLATRYFALMQRCNKYLEQSDALTMLALEEKYGAQIFMENAFPYKTMRTQENIQPTEQASIETLPVAEYNIFLQYERQKWQSLPEEAR